MPRCDSTHPSGTSCYPTSANLGKVAVSLGCGTVLRASSYLQVGRPEHLGIVRRIQKRVAIYQGVFDAPFSYLRPLSLEKSDLRNRVTEFFLLFLCALMPMFMLMFSDANYNKLCLLNLQMP